MTRADITRNVPPGTTRRREAEFDSDVREMAATAPRTEGRSDIVVIFDKDGQPAHRLGAEFARALARRLQKLADELEGTVPGSTLRRPPGVDEQLRDRDV